MNNKNEMNEEVRQLLDSLEEHGKNARRQQQLSDLIDSLETSGTRRRKLIPLWWAMGAAAACLLLWLLAKPSMKQAPNMEEQNLVEKVEATDSIKAEKNNVVVKEPVVLKELLAEETPVAPQKTTAKVEKPRMKVAEEKAEKPVLAEIIPMEPTTPTDTGKIGSNTIPTESETPSAVQKPQRRVIRSLNLVCYECQKDPEPEIMPKPNVNNRTLFGQPQDPNMKNGSLAFEFKLN